MLVIVILLVAVMAYLFVLQPSEDDKEVPTISYAEFVDDIEVDPSSMSMNFKSYDDGDTLYIVGNISNIRTANVPSGTFGLDSGPWTILYFGSSGLDIWDEFAYEGDLTSDYTIGQEGKIKIHIKEISVMGISAEYPDEAMSASMLGEYIDIPTATLAFTETSPGNYTGSVTSQTGTISLRDLDIEIYDSSAGSHGWDDGDLTDETPEVIDTWSGNLVLEFTDVNANSKLDSTDTFLVTDAHPGDTIELTDSLTYDTITVYTFT